MGQANIRKKRIEALKHVCVGPAPYAETQASMILIGRTDPDSWARFLSAVKDLINKPQMHLMLERVGQKTLQEAQWCFVTSQYQGGVHFFFRSNEATAFETGIRKAMDGFAVRKLRWNTLVFGSPEDVEQIRAKAETYKEDMRSLDAPYPAPRVEFVSMKDPKVVLHISKNEVETMDLSGVLKIMDTFVVDDEMLTKVGPGLILSISGFDDDPRFVSEIPLVNAFLRQVFHYAPWAPLIADSNDRSVWVRAIDPSVETTTEGKDVRINIPAGSTAYIMENIVYQAADTWSSRICSIEELPARLQVAIQDWSEFLSTGKLVDSQQDIPEELLQESEPAIDETVGNETDFWKSITQTLAPGWEIEFDKDGSHTPKFGDYDTVIYSVDVETGDVRAGAIKSSVMSMIADMPKTEAVKRELPGQTIELVKELAKTKEKNTKRTEELFMTVTAGLTCTRLYEAVVEKIGPPAGHFIYMVYTMKRGSPISRSFYANRQEVGLFSLPELYQHCAKTIKLDLDNQKSFVGSNLKEAGGLKICEELKRLL